MNTIGTHFDWYSWCYKTLSAVCIQAFPLPLPLALPTLSLVWVIHKVRHTQLIPWHTAGFE